MTTDTPTRPEFRVERAVLAVLAALVVNVAIWLVGDTAGANFDVEQDRPVSIPAVAVLSVVPIVIGLLALALLSRAWPQVRRLAPWTGLAVAGLTVAVPLSVAVDTTTQVTLAAMHLVVGAAWFIATALRTSVGATRA